jgi:hypothetical protein
VRFRLDRGAALMTVGVFVIVAAGFAVAAFWAKSVVAAVIAVGVVAAALLMAVRPPVVVRLDADGYRSRLRFSSGRFIGAWRDVDDAELTDGLLVLTTSRGRHAFPLRLVGDRRVQLLHAVTEHLNDAHGYRRWLG